MASATYENILREVERLTDDERHLLRAELARADEGVAEPSGALLTLPPVGALAEALQLSEPMRAEVLDAMERAIEEDFEVIDPDD